MIEDYLGRIGADSVVLHCSGALSSADLLAASSLGAAVASAHPVRSFADAAAVAQHFNSSPREIYRLAKAGRIPGYRVGRGWRFKLSECEAALREAP